MLDSIIAYIFGRFDKQISMSRAKNEALAKVEISHYTFGYGRTK